MKKISKELKRIGNTFRAAIAEAQESEIGTRSNALAFTTILAVVPLTAVVFSIFKGLGGLQFAYRELEPLILEYLSEGTGEIVASHLNEFITKVHATTVGWVGFAGLLITAVSTYLTIADAFQKIWEVEKAPPFLYRVVKAVLVLVIAPIVAAVSILVTTTVMTRIKMLLPFLGKSLSVTATIAAITLNLTYFTLLYRLIPWKRLPIRTIAIGSFLPAVLLEIAKAGFAIYAAKAVSYSAFYGSFAVIPLFFLWVFISWYITLFGAVWIHCLQLDSTAKKRSRRET